MKVFNQKDKVMKDKGLRSRGRDEMLKMMTLRSRTTQNLTSQRSTWVKALQKSQEKTKLKLQNGTDWQLLPLKAQPKRLIFALQMHFPDEDRKSSADRHTTISGGDDGMKRVSERIAEVT